MSTISGDKKSTLIARVKKYNIVRQTRPILLYIAPRNVRQTHRHQPKFHVPPIEPKFHVPPIETKFHVRATTRGVHFHNDNFFIKAQ